MSRNSKANDAPVTSYLTDDTAFVEELVRQTVQTVLEAEMTEHLGAAKGERTADRVSYRSGYYPRKLHMKVGTVELRVPQSRDGTFCTRVFERYRRSEKALVSTVAEMYVNGKSAAVPYGKSPSWLNRYADTVSQRRRSRPWWRHWTRS